MNFYFLFISLRGLVIYIYIEFEYIELSNIDLTYIKQSESKIVPKSVEAYNIIKNTKSQSKLNTTSNQNPSFINDSREYIQENQKDYNEIKNLTT